MHFHSVPDYSTAGKPHLVSVVIPTYNSARFLGQAIDSVLAQTYGDFEIIVVDDGSTDNTVEILEPYQERIRYIYQVNQGPTAAQITGYQHSKGDYLIFSGADDILLPNHLSDQTDFLNKRLDVGLVASGYQCIDENGLLLQEKKPWIGRPIITLESVIFGGLVPPVAVMVRRGWFERVDGFDPQLNYCEDTDLWIRLALAGCVMEWAPSIISQYRIHANNVSRSPKIHFEYHRVVLNKAFANPQMPEELRARKSERLSQIDLAEASRLLFGGWEEEARQRIEHALELNPDLLVAGGFALAEILAGLQTDVFGDGRMPKFTIRVLQDRLPELSRTLAVVNAKKGFYMASAERYPGKIRQSWLNVARLDPHWLLNRGGWSILAQSFFGFK